MIRLDGAAIFRWGALENVWWLLLAGLLVVAVWWLYVQRNMCAAQLNKAGTLLKHFRPRVNIVKAFLVSVGIMCLFCALMRPQWGKVDEVVEQHGRDLLIALDVSRSMLAQDVKPDRLSCAKRVIMGLMESLETDRIGLMVFSEKARVFCPLTQDRDLVKMFLESIDHTNMNAGSTFLDQPIMCALEQCKRFAQRKNHLLVIVSDGEDFSHNLESVKQQAREIGLTVLVIGIGSPQGAPIPVYNGSGQRMGYLKDTHGRVVISQLNKAALTALADRAGGAALFVDSDVVSIASLVARIKRFECEQQGQVVMATLQEQYPWFLFISFVCFMLEWLL